ncbi:MAG: (2Fe-2S) ferredoxin domain-containing protein [Magnetospirillum sp.]|nr:(2Fe-2S) ferredoxin domain-containing protein [Magnetospirillum sp.]
MNPTLNVCANRRMGAGSCAGSGSLDLAAALKAEIARRNLAWDVRLSPCLAHCGQGPNLKAAPGGPMLHGCTDAVAVLDQLQQEWRRK